MHAPTPELVTLYDGPLDGLEIESTYLDGRPLIRLKEPLPLKGGGVAYWDVCYALGKDGRYTFIPEASPLPFE